MIWLWKSNFGTRCPKAGKVRYDRNYEKSGCYSCSFLYQEIKMKKNDRKNEINFLTFANWGVRFDEIVFLLW